MLRGFGPRKGGKQKRKSSRKDLPFLRVPAKLMVDKTKEVVECRVFLSDLSADGVGCFSNLSLDKGEVIALVIEQPKNLFVKGEIAWCQPYSLDTKVISTENFKFRMGIKFLFDEPEEKRAIQNYINELYAENSK
jgi:hypothetical protein